MLWEKFGPAKTQIDIMAKIPPPTSNGFDTGANPPPGTYLVTILKMKDKFGVVRSKFDNPQETETVDLTNWLFGFQAPDSQIYKVQTFDMRISGYAESKLMKILTSVLGHPPEPGYDYEELLGSGIMISVSNQTSRNGNSIYPKIVSYAPVMEQLRGQVLPLSAFEDDEDAGELNAAVSAPEPVPTAPAQSGAQPYNPVVNMKA
jgi:hypothetical protein